MLKDCVQTDRASDTFPKDSILASSIVAGSIMVIAASAALGLFDFVNVVLAKYWVFCGLAGLAAGLALAIWTGVRHLGRHAHQ